MNAIPLWLWIVGGCVAWILISIPVAYWAGGVFRRNRERAEFLAWAREKDAIRQRGGLVVEFGHDRVRISSRENVQEIPIMPGTDVSLNLGPVKRDPDEELH